MLFHHGAASPPRESAEKSIFHSSKIHKSLLSIHNIAQVVLPLKSKSGIEFFYLLGLNKYPPGGVWIWIHHISFNERFTESQFDNFMINESYAPV